MPARTTPAVPLPAASAIAIGDRLLRWPDVRARTGLSRTTVWRLVRQRAFPAPRRLSGNAIGWLASEVDAWIASRTAVQVVGAAPATGGVASWTTAPPATAHLPPPCAGCRS